MLILPFYKQASLNNQFYLIHGFDVVDLNQKNLHNLSTTQSCKKLKLVYLLISKEFLDNSQLFQDDLKFGKKLIKIYPPWLELISNLLKSVLYHLNEIIIFKTILWNSNYLFCDVSTVGATIIKQNLIKNKLKKNNIKVNPNKNNI